MRETADAMHLMHRNTILAALLLGALPLGCGESWTDEELFDRLAPLEDGEAVPIAAEAAFSCDFGVDSSFPMEQVAPVIERDRMYMADQPGMIDGKHLPLSINFETGDLWSGGRYLFETDETGSAYKELITKDFVLDGVQFLEREEILDPDCHLWSTVAAFELGDIETDHVFMRTERWTVPGTANERGFLKDFVPSLVAQAEEADRTAVWLLYNHSKRMVEIVHIAGPVVEALPGELNVASLVALSASPSFGQELEDAGYVKVLDRSHFVLSIWFPFVLGDQGKPSLWPNSPPLPEPRCDDGLCTPSRGEDHASCPEDCTPGCGDTVCQADEDTRNCPGDCRL